MTNTSTIATMDVMGFVAELRIVGFVHDRFDPKGGQIYARFCYHITLLKEGSFVSAEIFQSETISEGVLHSKVIDMVNKATLSEKRNKTS